MVQTYSITKRGNGIERAIVLYLGDPLVVVLLQISLGLHEVVVLVHVALVIGLLQVVGKEVLSIVLGVLGVHLGDLHNLGLATGGGHGSGGGGRGTSGWACNSKQNSNSWD